MYGYSDGPELPTEDGTWRASGPGATDDIDDGPLEAATFGEPTTAIVSDLAVSDDPCTRPQVIDNATKIN